MTEQTLTGRGEVAARLAMICAALLSLGADRNVVDYGADPTGVQDSTAALERAHAAGGKIFYPDGVYRFSGRALDLSGGVRFESADGVTVRNDVSPVNVLQFDDSGNLIGLMQNHLELDAGDLGGNLPMDLGTLVRPPLSNADHATRVDLLAHWYNDFGLECTRAAGGAVGWLGWYYWSWNHHDTATGDYDPARHPLLGFYRGDDPVVLDWQCYWLREYGVTGVILYLPSGRSGGTLIGWERPAHRNHWVWQLFHNVPNFRGLRWVLCGFCRYIPSTSANRALVEAEWRALIEGVYLQNEGFYAIERGGRRYPVIYVHEEAALRGIFDDYRGAAATATFYGRIADLFRAAGYGGVAVFARHAISDELLDRGEMESRGVLRFRASYAADHSSGETYAERVANYAPPNNPHTIVNTFTAKHTHPPHPSRWHCPGHTPELFEALLRKAVDHVEQHDMPRIIACYNVAEWAEGGPGLQPNMQDRFGYLEAVRAVLLSGTGEGTVGRRPSSSVHGEIPHRHARPVRTGEGSLDASRRDVRRRTSSGPDRRAGLPSAHDTGPAHRGDSCGCGTLR